MEYLGLIEYIIGILGIYIPIYFFNKVIPNKNKRYIILDIVIIAIIYVIIPNVQIKNAIEGKLDNSIFYKIGIYYILIFIYPIIFRKGNFSEKVFWVSFYTTISEFIVYTNHILIAIATRTDFYDILFEHSPERIISIILSKVIQIFFLLATLKNMNFVKYLSSKELYLRSIIFTFDNVLLAIVIRQINVNASITLVIGVFILFAIQIISIMSINSFSKEMERSFILEMKLKNKQHEQKIIDMYKEMKGWKHDFRNHLNTILGLIELNSNKDVIEYINEINSITSKFEKSIYTENAIIDSILSSKINIAKEKNINVNVNLNIKSEIKLPNIDICTMMGNLMDNSIEACDRYEGYKFIDLTIVSEESRFIIKLVNSTNKDLNQVNGRYLTTKKGMMHGIGLVQIDSIVEKFDGYIRRYHNENIFNTSIMIQYKT